MFKFSLYCLLLLPFLGFSQIDEAEYDTAPSYLYISGGLNYYNFSSKAFKDAAGPGYSFGVSCNFLKHKTWDIQSDLIYNRNLQYLKYSEGGKAKEDVYDFQNFDVMFNGNYYLIPYEEDEFYMGVQAGPYFSIFFQKLAPVGDDDFAGRDYATGIDNGTFKNMPDTNFGANIGIFGGYEGVRLVLRYTRGFTNALQGVQANGSNLKGTLNGLSLTLYIGGKT